MRLRTSIWGSLIVGLAVFLSTGNALAECETVRGRIVSELVAVFSDGTPCGSGLGLCTEGRFTGDLKGRFRSVELVDVVTHPFAVAEQRDVPIVIARDPHQTLQEVWPSFEGAH